MIAKCINNEQASAPNVFENGHRHPEYVYDDLTTGEDHFIFAMHIYRDDLKYLRFGDQTVAHWVINSFVRFGFDSDSELAGVRVDRHAIPSGTLFGPTG